MATPKHAGGRPLIFKTVEELQEKIDKYFDYCDNRARKIWDEKKGIEQMISYPAPYTMSGLARALDIDRTTLINYGHRDKFFNTIRAARERVHEDVENRMMETRNEKGAMFSLKNNFGWKDESGVNLNATINTFNDEQTKRIAGRITRGSRVNGDTSSEEESH